jgi:hypothetical protein
MAMKKLKAGVKKVASKVKKAAVKVAKKTIAPAGKKVTYTAKEKNQSTLTPEQVRKLKNSRTTPAVRQPGFKQVGEKGYKPMTGKNLTNKKKKA